MGPTASGKTDLAMQLASEFPIALISVDSALVYQGMNIGTGKPSTAELTQYPHALIDIRDPSEPFSAQCFVDAATHAIQVAYDEEKIPVLVGGTMLYYRALLQGLSDLPSANPTLRQALEEQAAQEGLPALYQALQDKDPLSAQRIHANDRQRILRALEVHALTGEPLSRIQGRAQTHHQLSAVALWSEDRTRLHQRIATRLDGMFAAGFVDEVAALHQRGDLNAQLPSIRSVGYRQLWAYLDKACSLPTAKEQTLFATRQLAKRQFTWLRRWPALKTIPIDDPQTYNELRAHFIQFANENELSLQPK